MTAYLPVRQGSSVSGSRGGGDRRAKGIAYTFPSEMARPGKLPIKAHAANKGVEEEAEALGEMDRERGSDCSGSEE